MSCGEAFSLGVAVVPMARTERVCCLYAGNLSPAVTDAVLKQLMEPFGNVLHAVVLLDMSTGQSRGFGFVHMDCSKAAADVRAPPLCLWLVVTMYQVVPLKSGVTSVGGQWSEGLCMGVSAQGWQ